MNFFAASRFVGTKTKLKIPVVPTHIDKEIVLREASNTGKQITLRQTENPPTGPPSDLIMASSEEGDTASLYFLFFSSVLVFVLILSKALHSRPKLNSVLSEPALVLLIGMFVSFFVSFFSFDRLVTEQLEEGDDAAQQQEQQAQVQKEEADLTQTILSFPSRIFFMALLPPILFNSGYQLQRELFYRHIKPISLFSVLGTAVSGMATGSVLFGCKQLGWFGTFDPSFLELCTFGALIAATDTVSVLGVLQAKRVDPHLFSLVFGESALNDAVAIVLFRSFASMLEDNVGQIDGVFDAILQILFDFLYQAVGSPCLGIVFAFVIALLFKYVDLRETKMIELSLFVLLMYFPFIMAEEIHLSGIVSIFFAGLSARRYIEPNVSDETKRNAEVLFHLISYLAETCIFLELGLSVFGLSGSFQWRFIALAFVAALFGRALSVYPISILFNLSLEETEPLLEEKDVDDYDDDDASTGSNSSSSWTARNRRRVVPERRIDKRIPSSFVHVLWFAGLRGAVAYSCARDFPNLNGHRDEFTACTMVIVFVTIVVMGGCTEFLLDYLKIPMNVDQMEYMKAWRRRRRLKGFYHEFEYKYIYKGAVRKRNRAGSEDAEEIYARVADLSYGHGGRTPMPEIEMLDKIHVMNESAAAVAGNVPQNEREGQIEGSSSRDDASSSSPLSVDSDDMKTSPQEVV